MHSVSQAQITIGQTTKKYQSQRKLEMKQSEVIGFLHDPEGVCQHSHIAKWPAFGGGKKKKRKKKKKLCFNKIMICVEELFKTHINHFHSERVLRNGRDVCAV